MRHVATVELTAGERDAVRRLLDTAFDGDFDASDWRHTLGGRHFLIEDVLPDGGAQVVAHAAVVPRRLVHGGRSWRTGYVEAVAVDKAHRGRGHAATLMAAAERHIQDGYELGALSAATGVEGFYRSRGWLTWRGTTAVVTPAGLLRTPDDDDSMFVWPVPGTGRVDVAGSLACEWRDGDVW